MKNGIEQEYSVREGWLGTVTDGTLQNALPDLYAAFSPLYPSVVGTLQGCNSISDKSSRARKLL